MSAQTPRVLSRRTNGVLHPGATQTNESSKKKAAAESNATRPPRGKGSSDKGSEAKSTANDAETPKSSRTKTPSEGEKLVIRRLPPGMTQAEAVSILGQEWEVGKGKVDWFYFARGKVSNDPSKPTRPGRAYLHLLRKEYVLPLSEVVRAATWEDAKNTFTSTSLVGPPSLEFAAYKKVPGNKKRIDTRQGTIDQDPEFMAFLEGLANPAPLKEGMDHEESEETSKTEVTTTPLIEYLKEKKANKIKEAAAAKSAKHSRQETSSKGKSAAKEEDGSKKKSKDSKSSKSDKGPSKEPVKILTKKVAVEQAAEAAKNAATQMSNPNSGSGSNTNSNSASAAAATASAPASSSTSTEAAPKSRRAGIAQAARILQRDLGLSPGSAHRRARQDAAKADADSKPNTNGKDAAPAANENQTPTAAPVEQASSQPSKAQSTTSNTSKSQSSSRRTRGGGKNSEKGKNAESTSAENLSTPSPVILKKKPTNDADGSRASPSTANNTPSPQSNTLGGKSNTNATSNSTSNAASGGTKNSSQKSSAPAKKSNVSVSANAVRGFIKHANASQGITEAALRQVLETFGAVTFIEMDKRKGFAYVDFADHAGLVKAISSSPVTVAQGTVQVLERKDKKPANSGGGSSGNGNGNNNSNSTAAPVATPAAATASSSNAASAEKSTSRGRRGRGGGNKNNAAANGIQAAAAASGDASTTNGPG